MDKNYNTIIFRFRQYIFHFFLKIFKALNKPGFVFDDHLSSPIITYGIKQLTLKEDEQPFILSYLALLQRGFT